MNDNDQVEQMKKSYEMKVSLAVRLADSLKEQNELLKEINSIIRRDLKLLRPGSVNFN